jgi:hypothetical protein
LTDGGVVARRRAGGEGCNDTWRDATIRAAAVEEEEGRAVGRRATAPRGGARNGGEEATRRRRRRRKRKRRRKTGRPRGLAECSLVASLFLVAGTKGRSNPNNARPSHHLVADVAVDRHRLGVDLEDMRTAREVRQAELDLTSKFTM